MNGLTITVIDRDGQGAAGGRVIRRIGKGQVLNNSLDDRRCCVGIKVNNKVPAAAARSGTDDDPGAAVIVTDIAGNKFHVTINIRGASRQ